MVSVNERSWSVVILSGAFMEDGKLIWLMFGIFKIKDLNLCPSACQNKLQTKKMLLNTALRSLQLNFIQLERPQCKETPIYFLKMLLSC